LAEIAKCLASIVVCIPGTVSTQEKNTGFIELAEQALHVL
jgi:hypothetical protein